MISYEDFDLRIGADGSGFVVSARRGAQSASEPFEVDLSKPWDLWQLEGCGPARAEEQGAALFDALIRGKVAALYYQGRGGAGSDSAKGQRIRISIDPRDKRLRPLLQLPWEILFDRSADAGNLLAPDSRRPIVRMIDSTEETIAPAPGPLRRVLLALANPSHWEPLELEKERTAVEQALGRIPIYPKGCRQATRPLLIDEIRDGAHQIIHFMGHGIMDPALGEGALLLEEADGGPDLFRASDLAGCFIGRPMPRLVILAACSTAESGNDPTFGPFASVAAALVAAGLPAVIAMQTAVRDRSAIRFTERLYCRLAKGDPIEAAVSDARNVLRASYAGTLDWAVPVLFMRGQQGGALIGEEAELSSPPSLPTPASQDSSTTMNITNNGSVGTQVNVSSVQQLNQQFRGRGEA